MTERTFSLDPVEIGQELDQLQQELKRLVGLLMSVIILLPRLYTNDEANVKWVGF